MRNEFQFNQESIQINFNNKSNEFNFKTNLNQINCLTQLLHNSNFFLHLERNVNSVITVLDLQVLYLNCGNPEVY